MQQFTYRCFITLSLLLFAPGLLFAQKPAELQASVRVEPAEVQFGQPVLVVVEVKGCESKPEITIPTSDDCYISLAGLAVSRGPALAGLKGKGLPDMSGLEQHLTESLRGLTERLAKDASSLDPDALKGMNDPDMKKKLEAALGNLGASKGDEIAYGYHVHVKQPGTVRIPPFTVSANGQTVQTRPLNFHVSPARGQDEVQLGLSLSNPRPVVGQDLMLYVDVLVRREQVTLNNKTYPHLPLKSVHLSLPPLDLPPMELVRPLNEVLKDHAPPSGHHGYKVNHLPGEAVFLMEPDSAKDRAGVYRRRLEVPVRFTRVGKGSLPSANVAGDVWMAAPTKSKRSAGNWQPFVATSEPLDYEVRDLPASRPRDFRGNVGELHVTTSASQTKMPAGTPFTLTIRLEGQGYLPQQGSIDLTANPEFNHRFRMLIDNDRAASDTSREVTYTLRPLQAGIKEVPAVSVSYFDSRSDQFKTATSSPIPLEVTSGPAGAVADSSSQPVEAPEPDAAAAVPEQLPPLEDLAAAHKRAFFTRNLLPAGILILTVAVVLGVLVAGRFRPTLRWVRSEYASGTAARLRSRAAGHVRRRLTSKVQSAQEVRELLHQALRSHYDLPAGEVTSADVADRLRQAGVDDELVNACTDLLKACATAEFAPDFNSVSLSELAERARRLTQQLATVHRAVRSG